MSLIYLSKCNNPIKKNRINTTQYYYYTTHSLVGIKILRRSSLHTTRMNIKIKNNNNTKTQQQQQLTKERRGLKYNQIKIKSDNIQ